MTKSASDKLTEEDLKRGKEANKGPNQEPLINCPRDVVPFNVAYICKKEHLHYLKDL